MSAQEVPCVYQIRIELFGFERGFLESYLENALDSIRRSYPTVQFEPHSMLSFHKIIQFSSTTTSSDAAAFDFFNFTIRLVQSNNPPELFFTCEFPQGRNFFPGSQQIVSPHQPLDMKYTILNLNTTNGKLSTPPAKYNQEKTVVLHQFSLNLLKENLSFSINPFNEWRQVESKHGYLTFPPLPNTNLAPLPDYQQPAPEHYQRYSNNHGKMRKEKAFVVPPPTSRLGSWSVQNSQDWDMVPYEPLGPNQHNPPFQRRHFQKLQPQSIQPPSRFDYLDAYRKNQKNWEGNEKQPQENLESAAPLQPTSTASHDLIPEISAAQGDQITTSSVAKGNSLSTNAQVHPPPPASKSDSLHTPTMPRPLDNNARGRKSFQTIDMDTTPPLSSSPQYTVENPRPPRVPASTAAQTSEIALDFDDILSMPLTPVQQTVFVGADNQSVVRKTPSLAPNLTSVTQSLGAARVSSHEEAAGVRTRNQSKQIPDKPVEYETDALATWLDSNAVKEVYKQGDVMPSFLAAYSEKLLARANTHAPPDPIAQCLTPYLYLQDGLYALDKTAVTFHTLNLLDTLFEFEKASHSTPTKLANWFNQKIRGQK
jgi:hypothetical protein